ncbi:hypothetical protein CNR22_21520 [Sphingobacteriaceae bacterium]|nr:hypothetical protein CNR22_21520 [Sphingobacteriaceae bacterium]
MKIYKTTTLLFLIIALSNCKKDYTCQCRNPGGITATYKFTETKTKAKSICDKHNDEENSIPWSESYCELK